MAFTYFYTDITIQNQNLAENLQKNGGFIPGIRPGRRTQDYITNVVRRITLIGALFLGGVAIMPGLIQILNGFLLDTSASATLDIKIMRRWWLALRG